MQTGCPQHFSAKVICYNEEKHIANCLHSLRFCSQVVVVDSGSTDRTVEIARQFPNVEIAFRPFDNFINQKNFALSLCRHEWVVSLDADEMLTEQGIEEILALSFKHNGYEISRRPFIGTREVKFGSWNPDYKLRLFRKSESYFAGTNPHDTVIVNGTVGKLRERMLHYSYQSAEQFVERNNKYVGIMARSMYENGKRANFLDRYVHSAGNFLKSYVFRAGFLDGSLGLFLAWHTARGSYRKYRLLQEHAAQATLPH